MSPQSSAAAQAPDLSANGAESESPARLPEGSSAPKFSVIGWMRDVLGLGSRESALRAAIEEMLEEHEDTDTREIHAEERALLANVLHFGEITVSSVMVPLPDILALPYDAPFEDIKQLVIESRHTRIPVYKDTMDDMRGFLHAKDLIAVMTSAHEFSIDRILRQLLFVPPSMRILDLLVEMKRSRVHMAIVVDEFGGTRGLVTLEDLFEEIVGDIQDEHDTEEDAAPEAFFNEAGEMECDAKLRIDELEEATGESFRAEDELETFDTLGGLVSYHLGHVPEAGEVLELPNRYRIEILEADARRVTRVRLIKPAAEAAE